MLTLEEAKKYLRIEDEEEDVSISSLLSSSSLFLINATRPDVNTSGKLFKHAQLFLISHWYENRESYIIGQAVNKLPFALDSLIKQLQYGVDES